MVLEVVCLRQLNNQILNHYNMHLEIEKIEKDLLEVCGFLELMLHPGIWALRIQS